MHGFGDDKSAQVAFADFALQKVRGDNAKGITARCLRAARNPAHQPNIARTIDQTPAAYRKAMAQCIRSSGIGRIIAITRSTIDANRVSHVAHQPLMISRRKG